MTKNDFKMRALLAMCGNANLFRTKASIGVVINLAEELANRAVAIVHFDDNGDEPIESTKKILYDACAAIEGMTMPDGKMDMLIDKMADIEQSLDCINYNLIKIAGEDEEKDEE